MPDIHVRQHKDILWLILDRQPLNLLTIGMLAQFASTLRDAVRHPPRLIVITGMGEQALCAGIDLPDETEANRARLLLAAKEAEASFDLLRARQVRTVAIVKGRAIGAGCQLAALCDVVVAREDAEFCLPAAQDAIFTHTIRLPQGSEIAERARQGATLNAREALHLGLVHQVIPMRRFLADTEELLVMLASRVSF